MARPKLPDNQKGERVNVYFPAGFVKKIKARARKLGFKRYSPYLTALVRMDFAAGAVAGTDKK